MTWHPQSGTSQVTMPFHPPTSRACAETVGREGTLPHGARTDYRRCKCKVVGGATRLMWGPYKCLDNRPIPDTGQALWFLSHELGTTSHLCEPCYLILTLELSGVVVMCLVLLLRSWLLRTICANYLRTINPNVYGNRFEIGSQQVLREPVRGSFFFSFPSTVRVVSIHYQSMGCEDGKFTL